VSKADKQCPNCDNISLSKGLFDTYGNGRCSECHGSGHDAHAEFLVGMATLGLEGTNYPCKYCSGTGQCQMCGGSGRIWIEEVDDYGENRNEKRYNSIEDKGTGSYYDYSDDYDYGEDYNSYSPNPIDRKDKKEEEDDERITIHEIHINGKLQEKYYTIKGERYEVNDKRLLSNSREFTHNGVTLIYITVNGKEFLFDIKFEKD